MFAVMWMVLLLVTMGVAAVRTGAEPRVEFGAGRGSDTKEAGSPDIPRLTLYRHHSAAYWAWRFRQRTQQLQAARRRAHALTRMLLHRPSVAEAINLAGATYGNTGLLWSLARCETGGTFNPGAKNPRSDASGLLQFMPSTFASTPYRGLSLWSPYASAMAGGWMLAHGRRGEWVC